MLVVHVLLVTHVLHVLVLVLRLPLLPPWLDHDDKCSSFHLLATESWWNISITRGASAAKDSLIKPMKNISACSSVYSSLNRSSTFDITPIASAEGLWERSSIPPSLIRWSRLRTNPALFRRTLNDWHAKEQNWRYSFESVPPMPSTISFVRRKAGGSGLGSRPKINPKSDGKENSDGGKCECISNSLLGKF